MGRPRRAMPDDAMPDHAMPDDAMPDRAVMAQRAHLVLASTSDAVYFLDRDGRFTYLNAAAEGLLRRPAQELLGRDVFQEFPEARASITEEEFRRATETREPAAFEVYYAPLGCWFEVRVFPDRMGLAVFFRDVNERRRLAREHAEHRELTDAILSALPAPIAVLDRSGTIVRVNDAWRAAVAQFGSETGTWGIGTDYFAGWECAPSFEGSESGRVVAELRRVAEGASELFSYDFQVQASQGSPTWYHMQATPLVGARGIVITHTDVTERVGSEQAAARQARRDHLTNLPNRARLHEVISEALNGPARRQVTLLFLDLDGFKSVNDSLGHDVGDQLLKDMAARLAGATRPGDIVGRLGGDEFVVVALDCDSDAALAIAERIRTVLAEPFDVAGMHLPLSASIGIATSSEAGTDPEGLIRDADVAMYAAKNEGRDRHHVFTSELREQAREQLVVAVGLRQAIRREELVLHYQPVHSLRTGAIEAVEALMRWRHPELGLLLPATFIPLAEETGVIVPMGRWLLGEASRQAAAWALEGISRRVGVNISAAHLATGTLPDDVSEALAVTGVPADRLVIELTETSVARDSDEAALQLGGLRALGVQIAIDDFGAGYSSLGRLTNLPADFLKIDRGLLPGADGPGREDGLRAVVRAVTSVASCLGMLTVAEGVETEDQLEAVTELGCDLVQGYLLGRPVPAADVPAEASGDVLDLLRRRAGSPSASLR